MSSQRYQEFIAERTRLLERIRELETDCPQSSFGPTWHTVSVDMEHIDRNSLQAVGQTVVQVLFSEQ